MIRVRGLKFTYEGAAEETLRGLDFDVGREEIFGFLGPSGAGKSTTQKVLFGLLRSYSGEVRVLNREIREWGSELYERIGISFETPNHYSALTALENLEYFRALYEDTYGAMEVLEWVGLQDAADTRVGNFSKGMKVRLNVARSLLHKPRLLFLDEPTSGLDPVNARNIKDLIRRFRAQGAAAFISTHNMMVAEELCDRVAFITDGDIRTIDSPAALKQKYGRRTVVVNYRQGGEDRSAEFPLQGLGKNADFVRLLNSGNRIESLHSQETTLDDIFIQITGEELGS